MLNSQDFIKILWLTWWFLLVVVEVSSFGGSSWSCFSYWWSSSLNRWTVFESLASSEGRCNLTEMVKSHLLWIECTKPKCSKKTGHSMAAFERPMKKTTLAITVFNFIFFVFVFCFYLIKLVHLLQYVIGGKLYRWQHYFLSELYESKTFLNLPTICSRLLRNKLLNLFSSPWCWW